MGTSASNKGPNSGVPFDPPWLDDIVEPLNDEPDENQDNEDPEQNSVERRPTIAPEKRFKLARTHLGQFIRTGERESLRKAIGYYSREGMGGSINVATRMRLSTRTATSLFGLLHSARDGNDLSINQWISSLSTTNASTDDIVNEIVNKVAPNGGSIDETSCRQSMAQAINELLERNAYIDLFNLSNEDIWDLVEAFLGYEALSRICLDIGQAFELSMLSSRDKVIRINQMQDYLKAEISVQINRLRNMETNSSPQQLNRILHGALKNTFDVFEGSI